MSKILLVEDNPDAVKRIIRYINKIFAELDVVSFPEAGDALQYAKANDISFTRYHKLPGILCFVTSVCRCPRSWHSITWSATLMSCCVLQFLM